MLSNHITDQTKACRCNNLHLKILYYPLNRDRLDYPSSGQMICFDNEIFLKIQT